MDSEPSTPVEVSRRIEAPVSEIFRILSDPKAHTHLDGSGMLRGAESDELITGVGDVFVMNMYFPALGDYQMDNHVVEFEFEGNWLGARRRARSSRNRNPDGPSLELRADSGWTRCHHRR